MFMRRGGRSDNKGRLLSPAGLCDRLIYLSLNGRVYWERYLLTQHICTLIDCAARSVTNVYLPHIPVSRTLRY